MSEIPNFNEKPELEEKLDEDPTTLDEQTLIDVQLYKSRKLQARRDAGESQDRPGWPMLKPGDYAGGASSSNGTGDPTSPDSESGPDGPKSGPSEPGETTDRPTGTAAELNSEGMVDYYQSLKDDYRIVEDGTESMGRNQSTNGSVDASTTSDRKDQAPDEGSDANATPEETDPTLQQFNQQLRELQRRLDEYHEEMLALKDTIADLREENARLEERLDG